MHPLFLTFWLGKTLTGGKELLIYTCIIKPWLIGTEKKPHPCASSRHSHPSCFKKKNQTLFAFVKQGFCTQLSKIPKTALLVRAAVSGSGTNSTQETTSIYPSVTWSYLQRKRHVSLHSASSTATAKGAMLLRATVRYFKIKLSEGRPRKHTDLQKPFHQSWSTG